LSTPDLKEQKGAGMAHTATRERRGREQKKITPHSCLLTLSSHQQKIIRSSTSIYTTHHGTTFSIASGALSTYPAVIFLLRRTASLEIEEEPDIFRRLSEYRKCQQTQALSINCFVQE
jgi:hypothetical protein